MTVVLVVAAIAGWVLALYFCMKWGMVQSAVAATEERWTHAVEAWKLALVQRDEARRRLPIHALTTDSAVPNQEQP